MFPRKYSTFVCKIYLLCLNVTGFWPFDFDVKLMKFKFNVFYMIGAFVIVPYVGVNYFLCMNVLLDSVTVLFNNIVLKIISNFHVFMNVVNVTFIYLTQSFQWKKIKKLVYRAIDFHVNVSGWLSWSDIHYLPHLIKFTIKSVVFSATLIVYLIVSTTLIAPDVLKIYTLPGFIIPVLVNKFYPDVHYGGMLLAEFYFHRMNEYIRQILNVRKYGRQSVHIADHLDTIAVKYVELIEIVNEFNGIISFRVVLWILLGLFNLLIHLFMEYVFVCIPIRYGHSLNIVISAIGVIALSHQFMEFWFSASVWAAVLRRVDETETILSSVYVHVKQHKDKTLVKSVELFLNRIKHYNIQISGCGLFSLDGTFLYSIICTSASYLIILIQYELAMM